MSDFGAWVHRVKTYSLGMKQRLGIAAPLLKDPAGWTSPPSPVRRSR